MPNYRTYTQQDDQDQPAGDSGFRGVDMRDPGLISESMVSYAENMRFVDGQAQGRPGVAHVWQLPDDQVRGAGQFDDPVGGVRWLIVVVGQKVWRTREGGILWPISLPSGAEITGNTQLVQAFDKLFLFRGEPADDSRETTREKRNRYAPLVLEDFERGFRYVTEQIETDAGYGTGTEVIPPSRYAISWANRVVVVVGSDGMAMSDAMNYTRFSLNNSLRINTGSGDKITAIYPLGQDALVIAKQRSVHVLGNLVPNEYGNFSDARRVSITKEWGIIAPRSLAQVGADVWGLSRRGVVSARQTELDAVQAVDVPVSAPIEPLIKRINWACADQACAVFHENRYYLAVSIDKGEIERGNVLDGLVYDGAGVLVINLVPGWHYRWSPGPNEVLLDLPGGTVYSTPVDFQCPASGLVTLYGTASGLVASTLKPVFKNCNNAVFVFNTKQQAWEGLDLVPVPVREWVRGTRNGAERIFFVGDDGSINLWEEGLEDEVLERPVAAYVDVLVDDRPASGAYSAMGGSGESHVVADRRRMGNADISWGVATLKLAEDNFWEDVHGRGGYAPNRPASWPYYLDPQRIVGGVRFPRPGLATTVSGDWATKIVVNGPTIVRRPIVSELVTRGYAMPGEARTKLARVRLTLGTWAPYLDVCALANGVEEVLAFGLRKDRALSYAFAAGEFDLSNVTGTHGASGRQDYSVRTTDGGFYLADEMEIERYAETQEQYEIRVEGPCVQIAIKNWSGNIRVSKVQVACLPGARRGGTR